MSFERSAIVRSQSSRQQPAGLLGLLLAILLLGRAGEV